MLLRRVGAQRPTDWVRRGRGCTALRQATGHAARLKSCLSSDVVVVGGGLAGATAAVAAVCNGRRTVLLRNRPPRRKRQQRDFVPPVGAGRASSGEVSLDPRETGIVDSIALPATSGCRRRSIRTACRLVALEPNLVALNTHATGVGYEGQPNRIRAVDAPTSSPDGGCDSRQNVSRLFGRLGCGRRRGASIATARSPSRCTENRGAPAAEQEMMGNGLKYLPATWASLALRSPGWILPFPVRQFPARTPSAADDDIGSTTNG